MDGGAMAEQRITINTNDAGFVRTEEGRVRRADIDTHRADYMKLQMALTNLLAEDVRPLLSDYVQDLPRYASAQTWRDADSVPGQLMLLVEVLHSD